METHHDRIEKKPDVMLGKPVIKGTRIPVELIIRKLGEGASIEDILDAYPKLSENDVHAALLYAAEYMGNEYFKERSKISENGYSPTAKR
jgi:uncharacterized protein (DUF433 family)